MFWNYIKISLRYLKKYKGYSVVNILGLAIGITACLLIALYIFYELSYDNYHEAKDRIYRVPLTWKTANGTKSYAMNVPPLAPTLRHNFPQVEVAARLFRLEDKRLLRRGDNLFYENQCLYADPEIFNLLTIPFIYGNPENALKRPGSIVITEEIAKKYFDQENPLGEVIQVNGKEHEITGVVKNPPLNSHLSYSLFTPLNVFDPMPWMNDWTWPGMDTYIKLIPGVDVKEFEKQISHLAQNYIPRTPGGATSEYVNFLQPITAIHFNSNLDYESHFPVSTAQLYIFGVVGFLILLIASINFINLTTARSTARAKEVGLRKVIGAKQRQLVHQFLGESFVIALFALALALLFVELTLPLMNSIIYAKFEFTDLLKPHILFTAFMLTLFIGIIAGLYPAVFLSAFNPIAIIKGVVGKGIKSNTLRKIFVVGQFTISIILIVGTITIYKQLHFMKNKDLGFDKEQKLILPVQGRRPLIDNYETIKQALSDQPAISGITFASSVPGMGAGNMMTQLVGTGAENKQMMYYLFYDYDFIPQYNIKMAAGRSFKREIHTDEKDACVINMAAAKAFGWRSAGEALGKRIREGLEGREVKVIGVTEDFHYRGLQNVIEPLVIENIPGMFNEISLTIKTESVNDVITFVKNKWTEFFPDKPFEYFFLDQKFNQHYWSEERDGKIIGIFTLLGLIIACLGLFGLSSFTIEQRTKEIGIRKILGASATGILRMLSFEFIKWVAIAHLIAWPISSVVIRSWLNNFAYRTDIGILVFICSFVFTLIIAQTTVCFQSIKAALANPVESLRYE